MRGGTAHCVVIVSDEEIGSPLVRTPNTVIALNNPSVEKYEPLMAQHGHLIYNSSLTSHVVTRRNIHAIPIPGSEAAAELGHAKLLNMVMLGALLDRVPVLTLDALDRALEGHLPARRRDLLEANKLALRKGIELAQRAVLIPA
jgi:2-oxoglutarate ferredoxin oxidoreductase subunit gamma